ncbi:MAG: four helix bundle protein [Anaerolineaceae bacterium]|nr:four helix bundle protein [Anaerolineaceae bacterium]
MVTKGNADNLEERGLEGLQVWKRALSFAVKVCKEMLPMLPVDEKWVLASQLRRAVQSVPANIAEAYGRFYYQDAVRFNYIARGSLDETYSHLTLAHQLGYLPADVYGEFAAEMQEIRRMLNGYIQYLKRSKRGENEPGSQPAVHEDIEPYLIGEDVD